MYLRRLLSYQARSIVTANVAKYKTRGVPAEVVGFNKEELNEPVGTQVMIKMLAAPVNPADINMIEGVYALLPPLPAVAGGEGVGAVVSVGPGVKGLKVNDWVIPSQAGFGTWRSHAVTEESSLMKVSNEIPAEYAASLAVNPSTAYRLLEDFVKLKSGDVIVQNGATSTVGQCVIQLAKLRGVKTINIIRDRPNLKDVVQRLKGLGADVVVTEEFAQSAEMRTVLSDLAAPVLGLNCVGGRSATEVSRLLGDNATFVTYGGMAKQPVTVTNSAFIFKNISLRGFWLSRWVKEHTVDERQAMINTLSELVKSKKLTLALERKSFTDLPSVLSNVYDGYKDRKVVLTF